MRLLYSLAISASIVSSLTATDLHARWGTKDDASVEVIKNETKIKIKKDGTSVVVVDQLYKILNEDARQNYATEMIAFDKSREEVKVLEAETIVGEQVYKVPVEKIEIKPLASDERALRQDYQILVPFQNVVVGSVVHLKYETNRFYADMPHYAAGSLGYDFRGNGWLWDHSDITIESELPLETKISDPTHSLKVTKGKNTIHVKLVKPYIRNLVGEPDANYMEPANRTYLSYSTEKDYQKIGAYFSKFYEEIINQPLPPKLEEIRKKAASQKSEIDQIDAAAEGIIEAVHYLGNWDTAAGHWIPRPLQTITDTGYGDCKDYSVCLAAILRNMGYETHAVFVDRSGVHLDPEELPRLNHANHVMVKVINKSGTVYWVDPTNVTTMAGGIYHDISNRPALVLDPVKPSYESIPAIDYRRAIFEANEIITIGKDNTVKRVGSIQLKGERAEFAIREMFSSPASAMEDRIVKALCDGREPKIKKITLPIVNSRKVKDFKADYEIEEEHTLLHTNDGYGFNLDNKWVETYLETSDAHEGAVAVDIPNTAIRNMTFKGMKANNLEALNYSIDTPWVKAERRVTATEDGIHIYEKAEIFKSKITPAEIRSAEFKKLRETLGKQCQGVAIILSK